MSEAVWEQLVATALLGTERRPPARPTQIDGALAEALEALPWEDPEAALLGAAGLLGGYRAAGWQPSALEHAPAAAPLDSRPLCSPGADAIFVRLLDSGPGLLLPEWLHHAQAAGVRPVPEQLPALLDAASADRTLRVAALRGGGDRLRWLAGLNDRWAWAAGEVAAGADVEQRWETGTRDERLALLRAVRAEDPGRGRGLVSSTWTTDGAQERRMLLEALAVGLEPADEPLLEAALDDRSKPVREQAAELLASLPGSALGARMAQRLRPLVAVGGRLRRKLQAQPPEELDTAARRDGVTDSGAPAPLGVGAWRLAQIIGAAPLTLWAELTGHDVASTFALARGADHEPALKLGWRLAALRQRDSQWSAVIARETGDPELLQAVPPGVADEVAIGLLGGAPDTQALNGLLDRIPAPWSPEISRAATDRLASTLSGADDMVYGLRLERMALALDLQTRDAAVTAFEPLLHGDLQPAVRRALDELLSILDLRHAITRELTHP